MYRSLKYLKKASRAAGNNSDDILVSLEYDGGEDNLHNLETATNRMTSAIRIMENKERELKEKREVTKSTLAAVKLEKIQHLSSPANTGTGPALSESSRTSPTATPRTSG